MTNKAKTLFIIDRFEGDWAVIEMGNITFNIPKVILPKGSSEGDVIDFTIKMNKQKTEERLKQIKKLSRKIYK